MERYFELPKVAIGLSVSTIVTSLLVNYLITGTLMGAVKVTQLEPYGGYSYKHLLNFELWRLVVSQLIHVKQMHMIYNVLSLFALGCLIEKALGSKVFVGVWLVSGATGTFISTFSVPEPWNLGSGGSQAILGLAAAGLVLLAQEKIVGKYTIVVLSFTILPAFLLDVIYAENHMPKPGHIVSFLLGAGLTMIASCVSKRSTSRSE